jgi:hypothetical protein
MMNKYGGLSWRVSASFWRDERVSRWSPWLQRLALYLLTNPHRHLEGIYHLPISYASSDLKSSKNVICRGLAALVKEGYILHDPGTEVVVIRNGLKYQAPENPSVVDGALNRIRSLPKTKLLQEYIALAKQHLLGDGAKEPARMFCHGLDLLVNQEGGARGVGRRARQVPDKEKEKEKENKKENEKENGCPPDGGSQKTSEVLSHTSVSETDEAVKRKGSKERFAVKPGGGMVKLDSALDTVLARHRQRMEDER